MRLFYSLVLCFILTFSFTQKLYPFEKWTQEEINLVKSVQNIGYMDSTEKRILYLCNLVRINPKLFRKTYLQEYIDVNKLDIKNYYLSSLISTLEVLKPIQLLRADSNLYEMAKFHAVKMGERGKVGHDGFDSRSKKFLKNKFSIVGENCSYGSFTSTDIFMDLLIDEGISDLGHRKNILRPNFTSMGVSIKPHKSYGINCVMDFGCDQYLINEKPLIYKLLYWLK
jgi:hypothetical protein